MKTYMIIAAALLLSACDDPTRNSKEPEEIRMKMPAALKDCRTFRVPAAQSGMSDLLITRCPESATTTRYGKYGRTVLHDPNSSEEEDEEDAK